MLEYHAHTATLGGVRQRSHAQSLLTGDLNLAAVVATVDAHPGPARLGAILDRLLEHCQPTSELPLLRAALKLWERIQQYCATVADVRSQLEDLVLNPSQPGALEKYNGLHDTLQTVLKPEQTALTAELQAYLDSVDDFTHIAPHGRGLDMPVDQWSWRDVMLSRRTGAFAAAIVADARNSGSNVQQAFAYGAVAGYAGNAVGSTYLSTVVGGPRRSHRYRDRLATNTMGTLVSTVGAPTSVSLEDLRGSVTFGPPNAPFLPAELENLIKDGLSAVYAGGPPDLPDLQLGYRNLLEHLTLLSSFAPIPLPQPIDMTLTIKTMQAGLTIQSNPPGVPAAEEDPSSQSTTGDWTSDLEWWHWVLFGVCIALVAACFLVGICSPPQKDPYPGPFQKDPNSTSSSALTSYLQSADALISVGVMFDLHTYVHNAAMTMVKVMKLLGLLYPDPVDLYEAEFAQFGSVRRTGREPLFPHRPPANPDSIVVFPATPVENKPQHPSHWVLGTTPVAVLLGGPLVTEPAAEYGRKLWEAEASDDGASPLRSENLDLDADRGDGATCWRTQQGTFINDDPVAVETLSYLDV